MSERSERKEKNMENIDKIYDLLDSIKVTRENDIEIANIKKIIKRKLNKIINHAYHICGEHTEKRLNPGSIASKHHRLLKDTCNWDQLL